jgi:hypothetical protein
VHTNDKCALIFHRCKSLVNKITALSEDAFSIEMTVFYKNSGNYTSSLDCLHCYEEEGIYECGCEIDRIIRDIWRKGKSTNP